MGKILRRVMLIVLLGVWPFGTVAQPVREERAVGGLESSMEAALRQESLVGVVWTTITPEAIEMGAAGLADAGRGTALSANSRMLTGSIAKTVIAAGILQLVTEGKLTLDMPLQGWLPGVTFDNPWSSTHPVLLRHLLDHTAGLDDARLGQVFSLRAEPDAPLIASVGRDSVLRVRSQPGSRLSYSNLGYTLLGMVIERVTGDRYEHYLDVKLLRPLGMHDSTFEFLSQEGSRADRRLAMGHFERGETQRAVPLHLRPAGQFATTASDMARFARFLMSSGEIEGKPAISPHLLRAMGRPFATEAAAAGLDVGYGLGLNTRDRHTVIGRCHVGTTIGFRANLCLFPDEQKAFFVSMNADVETADYERFDALLLRHLGIVGVVPAAVSVPPAGIGDWQGIYVLAPTRTETFAYVDWLLGFATVRWDGSRLQLRPFQGAAKLLTPSGGWLFRAQDRTLPSHVLLRSADNRRVISDGFRSYEQLAAWRIVPLWISLASGLLGLAYLASFGVWQTLRGRLRPSEPLFAPALAALSLLLPIPLFASQSFLRLGDPTFASATLAIVSGLLPLAMLYGLWRLVSRPARDRRQLVDALAMLAVLQWAVVLVFWGLLPLCLWA